MCTRSERSDQTVSLSVIDEGEGIRPDHLERVLDPFFTTRAPGQGTGLGLTLVHKIVTDHGGDLDIHSQPGSGTTVRLELPLGSSGAETPDG